MMRRFVHFDANFRLVLSKRSNHDPSDRCLWSNGGFFADPAAYAEYLASDPRELQDVSAFL